MNENCSGVGAPQVRAQGWEDGALKERMLGDCLHNDRR